jgi:hypothetical protein
MRFHPFWISSCLTGVTVVKPPNLAFSPHLSSPPDRGATPGKGEAARYGPCMVESTEYGSIHRAWLRPTASAERERAGRLADREGSLCRTGQDSTGQYEYMDCTDMSVYLGRYLIHIPTQCTVTTCFTLPTLLTLPTLFTSPSNPRSWNGAWESVVSHTQYTLPFDESHGPVSAAECASPHLLDLSFPHLQSAHLDFPICSLE